MTSRDACCAGKHVLVEKPLTNRYLAEELIETCGADVRNTDVGHDVSIHSSPQVPMWLIGFSPERVPGQQQRCVMS